MALPLITSPEDVEAIVGYLRPKATGAETPEARAALGTSVMDGRKVSGYEHWGFVTQEGGKIKLTSLGRRFARADEAERQQIFGEVINSKKAYRMGADWIYHQGFEQVPVADLAALWVEHLPQELGTDSEDTVRKQVTCFFQLAEGAGLGEYKLGRGGKPTRFVVNREQLAQQVAAAALEPSASDGEEDKPADHEGDSGKEAKPKSDKRSDKEPAEIKNEAEPKVFIAHGSNRDIVEQVKTVLDATDLKYEIAVEEETTAIPVSEKVFEAMRRCTAAVICVTADAAQDEQTEKFPINENVLIEIGAAFVLYDKRVVLVWDRRLPIPSNLQGLYRCEFEGDELSWTAGMKLMRAVGKIKKSAPLD